MLKDTDLGKVNKILIFQILILFFILTNNVYTNDNIEGLKTDIKILDKISSKNELIKLTNNEEFIYKDLSIKSMKCTNPEITAYIQVRDLNNDKKDDVFIFNGWMFSSSPSITPFDHPVYDIWLVGCY